MGRKKSDSPTSFPWEKLFSESDNEFDQAISYCSSEHIGSDTVKKAVTTVVSGYNSGSKVALCDKIKTKANHIRQQILKTDDPESIRTDVIEFYKNTFLKKFEGKFEGINNIAIPPRPILPELSQEERKIYGSPPSSPRRKALVLEEEIPEIDLGSLEEESPMEKLLEAQTIMYASSKAEKDGSVKTLNAKEFYSKLKDIYEGTVAAEFMLNKDNVKKALSNLTTKLKNNKNKLKGVSEAEKIISNSGPFDKPQEGSITQEEIMEYIKNKGWSVPPSKSKEKLCDYVLTKLAKEDKVEDKKYEELLNKVETLTTNLFALIDMHEERIKKLEKIKKKRKVSFSDKDEIKIIEEEKKEIEEQISEVKDKLEEATKEKEEIDSGKEVKKQLCFRMREWLDQEDDVDRVQVEQDLSCGNNGICNVDVGECQTSVSSTEYSETIGAASIKGSKDTIDKIKRKLEKKKPLVVEEEEPKAEKKPLEKKRKSLVIEEEEEIPKEEPKVEEEEEIPDIELSEDEEEPKVEEVIRRCNTISLDEDVDEETRARDLQCGEGEICDLNMSMCVKEENVKEPVEEMTIGGMLVRVVGSNEILNKLKEKIMKSGGEIPAEPKAEQEPKAEEEEEPEEEPAKDVFQSFIPGTRPSLESIIQGIKSISRSTNIVSEQTKIKAANRKCLERIAKCAGINI